MAGAFAAACSGNDAEPAPAQPAFDAGSETVPEAMAMTRPAFVKVTLDGNPVEGAIVSQGGNPTSWLTEVSGTVTVDVDLSILEVGQLSILAAHPDARTSGADLLEDFAPGEILEIALTSFSRADNAAYEFDHPGEPGAAETSAKCAHCHVSINESWFASPHRKTAKNPVVQDLYAGTAAALATQADCTAAGGSWWQGLEPGTKNPVSRCYLGDGTLPALNPSCGTSGACDGVATAFGGCADCHAPAINGQLGGRDLLDATGVAYDYGVSCDVCHKVERIDLAGPPGVAGRLHILRPSEVSTSLTGGFKPLTFGPFADVANPRMGASPREHFHDGTLCAGCHQDDQPVLVPGAAADTARWPDGKLPVHSTYAEWNAGPFKGTPCQSCHMPPDPSVGNAADLYNVFGGPEGVATGWRRPPGSVLKHAWFGPRQPESGLHELAAALFVQRDVLGSEVVARVTVKNVGCGHAIPSGEPLRALILLVEASCNGVPLVATGGDAVPDFGGALGRKAAGDDWTSWPGAKIGDVVRVVRRTGAFHDYTGFGPFGDGSFDAQQKGMPIEQVVGASTITAVNGTTVTFDAPLPSGDVAYRGEAPALPATSDAAAAWAGAPGFAFARVMLGADGRRMVPHFLAVDVASDNRLLPQSEFESEHRFQKTCDDPEIHAVLVERAWPVDLARQRGWQVLDLKMAEARR